MEKFLPINLRARSGLGVAERNCDARVLTVRRGVGAMEIVAMDMKVSGMYIARQLSFSGVSFRIEEIGLDSDFKLVYNKAARLVGVLVVGVLSGGIYT